MWQLLILKLLIQDLTSCLPFLKNRIVTLSFAPFLVVHVNPAYTRVTGLSPADILGKPFHEVIEDAACKVNTAKASSLTRLHESVTSFLHAKGDVEVDNNKFRINVSVVGPEPSDHSTSLDHKSLITHYMISMKEHEEPEEEEDQELPIADPDAIIDGDNTIDAINNRLLVVPSFPILDPTVALMPAMRLHCGVMG